MWVVKPELRRRYRLPSEVPAAVQDALQASVKAPKKKALGGFWGVLRLLEGWLVGRGAAGRAAAALTCA